MAVPDLGYCATLGRALNFDGGTLEGIGYMEGTTNPSASTDVALSGTYSMKCTIPSGTTNGRSFGTYNNEANSTDEYFADGTEAWFSWDQYFSDFTAYNAYNYFITWLHDAYTWGTSGMGLRFVNNTSNIEFAYNGGGSSTGSLGALIQDTWEHWLVNIKFNQNNAVGEVNIWRNGLQVVTALKPSAGTYDEAQAGQIAIRIGFNRDSANTTLQTAYFDNWAAGTTRASVEDSGVNLLSATVASVEDGSTGWSDPNNCTWERSTEQAFHGSYSLKLTHTAGTFYQIVHYFDANMLSWLNSMTGKWVTLIGHAICPGGTADVFRMGLATNISNFRGDISQISSPGTSWRKVHHSFFVPSGTFTYAYLYLTTDESSLASEVTYVDAFSVAAGLSTDWSMPGTTPVTYSRRLVIG